MLTILVLNYLRIFFIEALLSKDVPNTGPKSRCPMASGFCCIKISKPCIYGDDVCGRPFSRATIHGDSQALATVNDQRKKTASLFWYTLIFFLEIILCQVVYSCFFKELFCVKLYTFINNFYIGYCFSSNYQVGLRRHSFDRKNNCRLLTICSPCLAQERI